MMSPVEEGVLTEWETDLSLDTALGLLAEKRCRDIVYHLQEETTPIPIADLAKQIADAESQESSTAPSDLQDSIQTHVHQLHIPKLADADVVVFHRNDNTVELGENAPCIIAIWNTVSDVPGPDDK
ncbi:DUF7344 domain-containing protein [Natranaeroarchaeum aerophilus]|uniref:DUF7344 domain-containing protein n=1 Tax=Natranaeroarchaeum aerophilus TaxID=2917711 RepID=A0AAE3FNK4_9EURY|nr:hypothetical protein [Natranaeroarchaeum aerophilus]MCL9812256.1 hypothetical protein [Natranaeroarchaeum aerophilus]